MRRNQYKMVYSDVTLPKTKRWHNMLLYKNSLRSLIFQTIIDNINLRRIFQREILHRTPWFPFTM